MLAATRSKEGADVPLTEETLELAQRLCLREISRHED
jgi:hypothetical protein